MINNYDCQSKAFDCSGAFDAVNCTWAFYSGQHCEAADFEALKDVALSRGTTSALLGTDVVSGAFSHI